MPIFVVGLETNPPLLGGQYSAPLKGASRTHSHLHSIQTARISGEVKTLRLSKCQIESGHTLELHMRDLESQCKLFCYNNLFWAICL